MILSTTEMNKGNTICIVVMHNGQDLHIHVYVHLGQNQVISIAVNGDTERL